MSHTDPGPSHDEHPVGVDQASVRRGYEEDVVDVRGIFAVPAAVVGFIVLALIVATCTFIYFTDGFHEKDPTANPQAVKSNEAPLNQRLGRLGRDGEATTPEKNQPWLAGQARLEGLQQRADNGATTSRPAMALGNAPLYHAEDLRPGLQPALQKAGWVDEGKKVARIPIEEAMKLAPQAKLFPVRKDAVKLTDSSHLPTAASAGRGQEPTSAKAKPDEDEHAAPAPKKKEEHK